MARHPLRARGGGRGGEGELCKEGALKPKSQQISSSKLASDYG